MINKAIAKITEEAMELDTPLAIGIEEHLTEVCKNDYVAGKLLDPGKSLKGACDLITEQARKQAKNGRACISDGDAFRMADEYFGIEEKKKTDKIDVMDLI